MMNNNLKTEAKKTQAVEKTSSVRYRSPDGLIFYSREEYLDYMEGLR